MEQGYTTTQEHTRPETLARLAELNEAYEKKFGFRFVVFVNGRSRDEIVSVLEHRLETGNAEKELMTGLREMVNIAWSRWGKLEGTSHLEYLLPDPE
ncbi:hypothetical protein HK104_007039 [Borealophlyctis nickersoniae]|nr:hypothetical protein HK104_007039 [Borealophlyctis nickersoniae]